MAFNPLPGQWVDNWASDGTDITLPIATFPEMTAAEADHVTTGDIRKALYAICEQLHVAWQAKDAADRPEQMTIRKTVSFNAATGRIQKTYSLLFNCEAEPGGIEVIDEPAE